jgi:hypothetical protein
MRMLAQYSQDGLLISIMKTNDKFILKFEIGPFEQVYKFFESETIFDVDSLKKLIDANFISKVFETFEQMNSAYKSAI